MSKPKVLIVEDDEPIRTELSLALDDDYEVASATNRSEALKLAASQKPGVVTLDLGLPPHPDNIQEGIRTLTELLRISPDLKVIIVSGQDERENAVRALEGGAFDFLAKPYELEELKVVLKRAFFIHELGRAEDASSSDDGKDSFLGMVGASPAIQEVFARIRRVSGSDASVLILGESGTGKELAARAIHQLSPRRDGPMIPINCGAIPSELLESELFGHEKGSFTGAIAQRKGKFEMANRGSIFLDEIGEMTLSTQKKLLRVLQEREFERVGGTVPVKVDTRVIAATNKNLPSEVREGNFREDLYYRLNVIVIYLPPLRDRREDIPTLVGHFLDKHRINVSSQPSQISAGAMRMLVDHDWPGNVRELENSIERAVVLAQGGVVTEDHISFSSADQGHFIDIAAKIRSRTPLCDVVREVERQMILEALHQASGDRFDAAQSLGIQIEDLYFKLRDFGISDSERP
jgi:putative PEP-CTERM system response regulator